MSDKCCLLPIHYFCYQCTKCINCDLKVTIASQEAVKARSYRGVVQPRQVVPRNVVPRSNSLVHSETVIPRNVVSQYDEPESNYQHSFKDEFWPKMWYFVSIRL